jgi:hypothetical protein
MMGVSPDNLSVSEKCDFTYEIGDYEAIIRSYYAIVRDGNTTEYEIIQTQMDTFQMQVEAITDMVVSAHHIDNTHRGAIKDIVASFGEAELPTLDDKSVSLFIDTCVKDELVRKATDQFVNCDDENFQLVADHLGKCDFSVMLSVIGGDENSVSGVMTNINNEAGREIFKTGFVWSVQSTWLDGTNFDYVSWVEIFKNYSNALKYVTGLKEDAIDTFSECYDDDSFELWEEDNIFQVRTKQNDNYHDKWEGYITKIWFMD